MPVVDIIVISHNHYDHLDADFVESLPNKKDIGVVVPLGIGEFFRDKDYIKIHGPGVDISNTWQLCDIYRFFNISPLKPFLTKLCFRVIMRGNRFDGFLFFAIL